MQKTALLKRCLSIKCGYNKARQAANLCTALDVANNGNEARSGDSRLGGKVAIVTGGASGIGEATCRLFASQGAKVIIADIKDEDGHRVQEQIGGPSSYCHCDVTIETEVASLVDFALAKYGALHVMFNNAGVTDGGHIGATLSHLNMDEYMRVMDVNVKGVVHGIKHAARVMQAGGSIICTGSVNSEVAIGNNHAYTIAKHAVAGIVKTAAFELGAMGVRVNAVSPWVVATPMVVQVIEKFVKGITCEDVQRLAQRPDNMPLQGVGGLTPHDVAQTVLFLASDESRFVSGHNLIIDGAFTTSRRFSFF
ncbi:hypothetical protein L7F22_043153 [Adiantum nelumboides]|nr:hypothetical protein [Adiantum nelumboides]